MASISPTAHSTPRMAISGQEAMPAFRKERKSGRTVPLVTCMPKIRMPPYIALVRTEAHSHPITFTQNGRASRVNHGGSGKSLLRASSANHTSSVRHVRIFLMTPLDEEIGWK